jgi:hypothetical protein
MDTNSYTVTSGNNVYCCVVGFVRIKGKSGFGDMRHMTVSFALHNKE